MNNKNFIYGIAVVTFGAMTIGWIEKGSWDWGGTKPESVDVEAEQVPDAPVLTLLQKNGQVSPTFNLIQLDYKNIKAVLGGTLVGSEDAPIGWKAPTELVQLAGARSDRVRAERLWKGFGRSGVGVFCEVERVRAERLGAEEHRDAL